MTFNPERHARRLAITGWLLAVGGAIIGGWVGGSLAFVGLVLLLLACVSTTDGFLLLGPIAAADARRYARRGRPWLWRAVYAAVIVVILVSHLGDVSGDTRSREWVSLVNEQIADWFAVCLFLYVTATAVLTAAGGIPDDRSAKRWDILRTTDLRPREIVFGKLAGQAPVLLEPLLTATPVLAVLPLFGGVSPWFPAAVLACCAAAGFGLGTVALFYSVFAKTGRQAAGWTATLVVLYLFTSGIAAAATGGLTPVGVGGWLKAAGTAFAAGNPFVAWSGLKAPVESALLAAAGRFVAFHLATGLFFAGVASLRLPRAEEWEFSTKSKPAAVPWGNFKLVRTASNVYLAQPVSKPPVRRPPMGDRPLVWWERYGWLSQGQRQFVESLHPIMLTVIAVSVGLYGVFARFVWPYVAWSPPPPRNEFLMLGAVIGMVVCSVGAFPVGVMPLFRAARCVARERTANTLESLLTALGPREVLFQKWLGVSLSEWPALLFLLCAAGPLVVTGVLPVVGGVLFFGGLAVMSMALVAVGLAVSVRVRTPGQGTAVVAIGLAAALLVAGVLIPAFGYPGSVYTATALVPPFGAVGLLAESMSERPGRPPSNPQGPAITLATLVGILGWGTLGRLAWLAAVRRLDRESE
jgi:hypothetical protein